MRIKVATWNVSECVTKEWKIGEEIEKEEGIENSKILNEIINYINDYDIDVVGFQEFPCMIDGEEKIAKLIAENTKLKYYELYATCDTFLMKNGTSGVAIFSKYQIINKKTRKYWNPNIEVVKENGKVYRLFDKGIITTTIDVDSKKVDVINSHALAWGISNLDAHDYPNSYKELDDAITESFNETDNIIMMGDLNATDIKDLIPNNFNKLNETIITDETYKGASGAVEGKIDYLMISNTLEKIKLEVLDNSSDHYVFVTEIEI